MATSDIDDFDRRILAALQEDNLTPAEVLAERVGLSPSAVRRRIAQLRKDRIISSDVAVIDAKAVGQGATFIVEIMLDRESPDLIAAFKDRMRAAPEVQQCYYVTGDADFVLVVTAPDVGSYESIIDRLFNDRSIREFKTAVVISRVKATLAVPIEVTANPS